MSEKRGPLNFLNSFLPRGHWYSAGHSARRRHRPSSANRGFLGQLTPSVSLFPIGTTNDGDSRQNKPKILEERRDSRNQVNGLFPIVASQFFLELSIHQIFPSVPIFPPLTIPLALNCAPLADLPHGRHLPQRRALALLHPVRVQRLDGAAVRQDQADVRDEEHDGEEGEEARAGGLVS